MPGSERDRGADEVEGLALGAGDLGQHRDGRHADYSDYIMRPGTTGTAAQSAAPTDSYSKFGLAALMASVRPEFRPSGEVQAKKYRSQTRGSAGTAGSARWTAAQAGGGPRNS